MAHIAEALHEITRLVAEGPGTTTAKGFAFERLIKQALKTHPGEYGPHRFEEVWLWSEWPGNEGEHDHGIDLVARQTERYGGGLCAIQCKFYDPDGTVSYTDVTKFLAASESGFTDRIFVATCQIAANGEKVIAKAQPPCQVLMATDMDDWVDDWRLFVEHPELLELTAVKHEPRPDQLEALDKIEHGLTEADRGKLILPCGTGKSVVALWTAERLVGAGGRVVYFVPSLALMGQTMREWARHRRIDHSYLGVCSDQTVGRKRDDPYGGDLFELAMRVTTNREALKQGLVQASLADDMQVVFCTYQSAPVLAEALDGSDIHFDLMICDEAHRTTGIQNSRAAADGDSASGFHMVHDDSRIPARKRLYMTATPRVFTEQLKQKAERLSDEIGRDVDSFSMDDEATYGNDLYKMTFSDAIDRHLLTDYELLVIAVSDSEISDALRQKALVGNFETNDVVRLMGCWDALADPETEGPTPSDGKNRTTGRINRGGLYAKTAIAFSNTVKSSKQVREWWSRVVEGQIPASESSDDYLTLSVQHIDGSTPASQRATQISALRDAARNNEGRCRILSNARVLTEGVDVPALDAVIFLENRKSKIDITQAVGRVMRRAPDKEIGYVIVPVVVPEDRRITDKQVLDGSDFKVVWDVVRALRSHDERVDYWVNNLAAVKEGRSKIRILDRSGKPPSDETETVDLDEAVQLRMRLDDKIASKIVDMAGDRRFWPTWGERAAQVCEGIHDRLREAVEAVPTVSSALDQFVSAMQTAVGPQVTRESATEMIAQHVVTIPVFDHIFEESQFAAENPVSKEIERVLGVLREEHITFDHLTANLARSYRQMHRAFEGAESPAEKVDILRQIYEGFFQSAMKDTVKRLGIVYTPVQLVDFILRSADAVCRQEFGYGLTDEGVHVLDPFAGTGTFLYRLLTMKDADGERLIRDEDLQRKYRDEMHANEIVLLAYYIAALKIEAGMAERGGFLERAIRRVSRNSTEGFNAPGRPRSRGNAVQWIGSMQVNSNGQSVKANAADPGNPDQSTLVHRAR